ncbi:Cytochrome c, mono-and diheme variants [bacterium A37T11]|nr:Cytochrome c, mono-and diheme variants [bacterium A37T11]
MKFCVKYFFWFCLVMVISCQSKPDFSESPVLSASESMKKMEVEKGLKVELVAAEPLVNTPIAMTFDEKGRIWMLEMQSYMPDTVGTGEDAPTGKVVILEDKNGDGVYDNRKIFLDSLVLPRALCLIENGVLVAEPPKLWYVDNAGDKAGKKILVDSAYAEGGNVEHQPNGLLRAMDNWIYNAKSSKRYRKEGDKWLIEENHFRGQWGITQDNYGRLYYNNNSENLLGDYFGPGLGAENLHQQRVAGYDEKIVPDNRLYASRPNTGVNRGYVKGTLDDSLRLVNFTAASAPAIYRGDLFDKGYAFNAFTPEPAANLIKRNILSEKGYRVEGKQAYAGREFLRSTDERFRPVSVYSGPDGAIYVVDMYHGIIQHKTYLTDYLKKEIKARDLNNPVSCGRIYRILPKDSKPTLTTLPHDAVKLVDLLGHANGWVRDKAQQLLIDGKMTAATPLLRQALQHPSNDLKLIHALWTLEGLHVLQAGDVLPLLRLSDTHIRMQALQVIPSLIGKENHQAFSSILDSILAAKDSLYAPVIGYLANNVRPYDAQRADRMIQTLQDNYPGNRYVLDAVLSNLHDRESVYLKKLEEKHPDTASAFYKRLSALVAQIKAAGSEKNTLQAKKNYPKGEAIFTSVCSACHGADGNGVKSLAPPFNGSQWVQGDPDKLIPIVLYGLVGPVEVGGKMYKVPEVSGEMPGIGQNDEYGDEDIAQILNFIRHSWSNQGAPISKEQVAKIREKYKGRKNPFTVDELMK